jgi:aryl-alcohol dehydrogenase-like predicted oxidoreductase
MEHRPLGNSGLQVSVVARGTWAIDGENRGRVDDDESVRAI